MRDETLFGITDPALTDGVKSLDTQSSKPVDILAIGEAMVEFNEQPNGLYLKGFGGDTSNTVIAAARQGARSAYWTRLGADPFGDALAGLWQEEGVDDQWVQRDSEAATGIYFVNHDADGHHFSYLRKGSAASLMTPDDLSVEMLDQCKVLHVSGISLAISETAAATCLAAMSHVREAGGMVSLDTNLRLQLWSIEKARAVTHAAMALSSIALPGFDDACQLTGQDTPDAIANTYLEMGADIVALTMGAEGTLVATADDREHLPAFPVKAVDATAAGDTFDGAFLAEYVRTSDPFAAARYANATAALSTQGYGAVAPMPRRTEVEQFIAERTAGH